MRRMVEDDEDESEDEGQDDEDELEECKAMKIPMKSTPNENTPSSGQVAGIPTGTRGQCVVREWSESGQ